MKIRFSILSVLLTLLLTLSLCVVSCGGNQEKETTAAESVSTIPGGEPTGEGTTPATEENTEPSAGAETAREWTDFY